MTLGREVHAQFSGYDLNYDIIGELETSAAGNLIFRVGRTNVADERWQQIAHITLTPNEVQHLFARIEAQGFVFKENDAPRS